MAGTRPSRGTSSSRPRRRCGGGGHECGAGAQAALTPRPLSPAPAQAAGESYQVAVYVVDFDGRGRRESVSVMDGVTLAEVSPPTYAAGEPFAGGLWLVWRYNASLRLRFNYVRGDNQVVSAILFD